MKSKISKTKLSILLIILFLMGYSTSAMAEVKASYLYTLSNFTGPIPYSWVELTIDKEKNEVYVCNGWDGSVRIFNENAMEVYNFGEDSDLGNVSKTHLAVDKDGNILVLSYKHDVTGTSYSIIRCNFRGAVISRFEPQNLPSDFSGFSPSRIIYREYKEGRLYLVDKNLMKIAVTDMNGAYLDGYDLAALLGFDEKKRRDTGIVGFNVDKEGNIFFTIPVQFQAYRLSPNRKIVSFGQRGSAPGKFNIVGGIATDDKGYLYLTDTLRCVVMIFDKDFKFLKEFGYRGYGLGNLIAPMELTVDNRGRIYVSQSARRGVSVFQVKID
jgi:DNA-binding beta-propeller fold protein YncE